MAKAKTTPADTAPAGDAPADVAPAFGDGFDPPAETSSPIPDTRHPIPDERDAEIAALKARVAELEAAPKSPYAEGKKYRVSIKDGPTCVVEPEPGEHPFEALRRLGGVARTEHAPSITEAGPGEPCGTVLPDGRVRPFAPARF